MSFGADLRTKLLGLAGGRVYWEYRPQNTPLPAIVLHEINSPLDQTFDGPMGTQGERVQADCMTKTKVEAWALRDAVTAALIAPGMTGATEFQGGTINLRRPVKEDTPDGVVHTFQIDATIWWCAAVS